MRFAGQTCILIFAVLLMFAISLYSQQSDDIDVRHMIADRDIALERATKYIEKLTKENAELKKATEGCK